MQYRRSRLKKFVSWYTYADYRYTGIKISNAENMSDFFTSVFPFIIDRSRRVLIPSGDNDINLFLK